MRSDAAGTRSSVQPVTAALRSLLERLPTREREIASLIVSRGELTAAEVVRALPVSLSNSAVRSMLQRLEAKGVLRRRRERNRFIYLPASTDAEMRREILCRVASEHFGGSLEGLIKEAATLVEANLAERQPAEGGQ